MCFLRLPSFSEVTINVVPGFKLKWYYSQDLIPDSYSIMSRRGMFVRFPIIHIVKLRQGSARDGPEGKRPQSLQPCLELTLKLVVTHHHHRTFNFTQLMASSAQVMQVEVKGGV